MERSFFTPTPLSARGHAPVPFDPVPDWDEVPDPYGNFPSVRITADLPHERYTTVDEDTDEQYICGR